MPESITPKLIRPKEAAAYIAVSERTLFTLTKSGNLLAVRIGASVRYCREDLDAFITRCRTNGQEGKLKEMTNA